MNTFESIIENIKQRKPLPNLVKINTSIQITFNIIFYSSKLKKLVEAVRGLNQIWRQEETKEVMEIMNKAIKIKKVPTDRNSGMLPICKNNDSNNNDDNNYNIDNNMIDKLMIIIIMPMMMIIMVIIIKMIMMIVIIPMMMIIMKMIIMMIIIVIMIEKMTHRI